MSAAEEGGGVGVVVSLARNGFLHEGREVQHDLFRLVKKPFSLRLAEARDVDRLHEIETICWHDLAISREKIEERLRNFPNGQWVATVEEKVVGVMYTQRLSNKEVLNECKFESQCANHNPSGVTLQLLGVAVHPNYASFQISLSLRDFVVRLATMTDIHEVVAMTRCSKESKSEEDYFERVFNADDPTLSFHIGGGAEVVDVIRNFRPDDNINFGHAVMIRYDLGKSQSRHSSEKLSPREERVSGETILALINRICDQSFELNDKFLHTPFMDLGLDSLKIMEFRSSLIEAVPNVTISQSIVFDYPSPWKLINHLNGVSSSISTVHTHTKLQQNSEDLVICGASCRFPGGANNPTTFFNMLRDSCSMIQPIPASWKSQTHVSTAGLLEDHAANTFDPSFFGISAAEALQMDPHQRLLLEVAYEALYESQVLQEKNEIKVGVYVGLCNNEWILASNVDKQFSNITPYTSICTAQSAAANRISFVLGLTGPSLVVDTACSSSLSALHVAIQALKSGDCDAAVVAAVDLLISPYSLKVPTTTSWFCILTHDNSILMRLYLCTDSRSLWNAVANRRK